VDSIAFFSHTQFSPELVKNSKSEAKSGELVRCEPFNSDVNVLVRERYIKYDDEPYEYPATAWERKKTEHIRNYSLPKALEITRDDLFAPIAADIRTLSGEGNIVVKMGVGENGEQIIENIDEVISGGLAIIAKAGYGKSTILGCIARHFIKKNIRFATLSYTHATVQNLNVIIGAKVAVTVSSFLGLSRDNLKDDALIADGRKPIYCKWNKDYQYVIIDEFGMVPQRAWSKIFKMKNQHGTQLILAADPGQLPAIGEHMPINPYRSLIKRLSNNRYLTLTTNWRARSDPIFAQQLDNVYKGLAIDFTAFGTKQSDLNIVATNRLRDYINTIRCWQNTPDKKIRHPHITFRVYPTMPVICDSPVPGTLIENAFIYTVRSVTDDVITLTGKDWDNTETMTQISAKLFNTHFLPRYAITCDKAQGQTFKHPYTIYEYNHFLADRWGWRYVALSRATQLSDVNIGQESDIVDQYNRLKLDPDFIVVTPKDYKMGYIYVINQSGRPVYVGQTWNVQERIDQHKQALCNTPLSMNIKQFGWESFELVVVFERLVNQAMLNIKEDEFMRLYDPPYNQLSAPK
jgi:hypothetical protein